MTWELGSLQCLAKLNADGSGIQGVPTSISLLTNLRELSLVGCKGGESKSRNLVFSFHSSPTVGLQLPSFLGLHSLKVFKSTRLQPTERSIAL